MTRAEMGAELRLPASRRCFYPGRYSTLGVLPPSTYTGAGRWKIPSLSILRKLAKTLAGGGRESSGEASRAILGGVPSK